MELFKALWGIITNPIIDIILLFAIFKKITYSKGR